MKILKLYFLLLLQPSITLPSWKNKELFRPEKLTNFKPTAQQELALEKKIREVLDEENKQKEYEENIETLNLFHQIMLAEEENLARDEIRNKHFISLQRLHQNYRRPKFSQQTLQEQTSHIQYFRSHGITKIKKFLLSLPENITQEIKAFIQKKIQ